MWRKLWFNVLAGILYTIASFGIALAVTPPDDMSRYIIGGALAYGCGNVHFVLWFTFYTRWKKEQQVGMGSESQDEIAM